MANSGKGRSFTGSFQSRLAAGNFVAQIDQRPYFDILAPYSWIPGIPVVDPKCLELPSDLAPGTCSLTAGLYNPVNGERYPVSGNSAWVLYDQ